MASELQLPAVEHGPYAALAHVFDLLNPKDLSNANQVCRSWKEVADQVWPHLASRLYPLSLLQLGDKTYDSHKALVLDGNRRNAALSLPLPPNGSTGWRFNSDQRYYRANVLAAELNEHPDNTHVRLAYDVRGELDLRKASTSHLVLQVVERKAALRNYERSMAREAAAAAAAAADGQQPHVLPTQRNPDLPEQSAAATILVSAPVTDELRVVDVAGHFRGALAWDAQSVSLMKESLLLAQKAIETRRDRAMAKADSSNGAEVSDPAAEDWVFQLVFLYANSIHPVLGIRHSDYQPILLLEGPVTGKDPFRMAWQHQGTYATPGVASRAILPADTCTAAAAAAGAAETAEGIESRLSMMWATILPEGVKARGQQWSAGSMNPSPGHYIKSPTWSKVLSTSEAQPITTGALDTLLDEPYGEDTSVADTQLDWIQFGMALDQDFAFDEDAVFWDDIVEDDAHVGIEDDAVDVPAHDQDGMIADNVVDHPHGHDMMADNVVDHPMW